MGAKVIGAIITLVIMFVLVIALIGAYANLYNDGQDFVKQGCRPVAFNDAGIGTMWDCPPGVTKGVSINP